MKPYGWKCFALIVCAALIFIWLVKAPITGAYLTKKMRMPVSVGWIRLWPGNVKMHSFKIKNPPDFKDGVAFKAGRIECSYRFSQLFGDSTRIDQISIRNALLQVDFSNQMGTRNNWTSIAERMEPSQNTQQILIGGFVLTDLTVEVHGLDAVGTNVPGYRHFDRLELDSIESWKGFPTEQLVRSIFQSADIDPYLDDYYRTVTLPSE